MEPTMNEVEILLGKLLEKAEEAEKREVRIEDHLKTLNGSVGDHSTEIELLKNKAKDNRNMIIGMWSVIIATVGGLITVVFRHLGVTV